MKTLLFCGGACWSRENPFRDPTGLLLRRELGDFQKKILENLDRIRKERRMIRRQRISRPREGLGWNIGRPAETDIFAGVTPGWFLARGETRCRGKWQSRRRDNSFGTSRDGIAFDRIWPGGARCKDTWQTSFFKHVNQTNHQSWKCDWNLRQTKTKTTYMHNACMAACIKKDLPFRER